MTTPMLSVWQPWASLLTLGIKSIETRCDPAPEALVGRRIALHASSTPSKDQVFRWVEWKYPEAVERLKAAGLDWPELPRGVVLATATLAETRKTDWRDWPKTMSPVEDFWGWCFEDIRPLDAPIAFAAEAGLHEVELEIPGLES